MEKHFTQSVRSVPQKKIGGPLFLFTGEHNFINKEREVQHKVSPVRTNMYFTSNVSAAKCLLVAIS